MSPRKIENMKITATMLGPEDHGIFSCYIHLTGAGSGVSFGGYALDEPPREPGAPRTATPLPGAIIAALLRTLKVSKWEALPGTFVRVEHEGWGGKVVRIGHLMEDRWFDFASVIASYQEAP